MSAVPKVIGVVGAGTMGAGIAQLAAQAGARTLAARPGRPARSSKGLAGARERIARGVEKGRLRRGLAGHAGAGADELADLAPAPAW